MQNRGTCFGFTNIWINPGLYDLKHFPYIFKQRLLDCFTQKWHSDLQENRALVLYKHFKVDFSYEPYLNFYPTKFRVALSKLRLSAHSLLIETGRYARSKIDRSERRCTFCDTGDLEDEYHFTLICSRYIEIRRLYLKQYYYRHPSVHKFIQLMQTSNKKELKNLCRYLFEAFNIRKSATVN